MIQKTFLSNILQQRTISEPTKSPVTSISSNKISTNGLIKKVYPNTNQTERLSKKKRKKRSIP